MQKKHAQNSFLKHTLILGTIGLLTTLSVQEATAGKHKGPPIPVPGLSTEELDRFEKGLELFEHRFHPKEGRGPIFNRTSCKNCHRKPTVGGLGPEYRSNIRMAIEGVPGEPKLFHERSNRGGPAETIPPGTLLSKRRPPSLFGLGLVEAIPEDAILANADPFDQDGDGISGRAAIRDSHVMRFGSQAHQPSLFMFVADALLQEIGLTSPIPGFEDELPVHGNVDTSSRFDIPQPNVSTDTVHALTDFITFLAPPSRKEKVRRPEKVQRGEEIFHQLQCAACHTPSFTTSATLVAEDDLGIRIDSPAILNKEIHPYSDFLLHDLGFNLNDDVALGVADSVEYRTPPLWGLRFHKNQLLHDSRAASIEQAILYHGGEAENSRSQYLALPQKDRNALRHFLKSL